MVGGGGTLQKCHDGYCETIDYRLDLNSCVSPNFNKAEDDACIQAKVIHYRRHASDYHEHDHWLDIGRRTQSSHATCPPGYLYFITENDKTVLLTILYHSPCFCNVVMVIRAGW